MLGKLKLKARRYQPILMSSCKVTCQAWKSRRREATIKQRMHAAEQLAASNLQQQETYDAMIQLNAELPAEWGDLQQEVTDVVSNQAT